jgi:hypothetical protein
MLPDCGLSLTLFAVIFSFCSRISVNGLLDLFIYLFQDLEKLTEKFSENVLDATKKFEKLITDKKQIDGLPASALGLAAQTAVSKVCAIKYHSSMEA